MHCVVFGMLKNLCVPEHSQGKYNVTKENVKKKSQIPVHVTYE